MKTTAQDERWAGFFLSVIFLLAAGLIYVDEVAPVGFGFDRFSGICIGAAGASIYFLFRGLRGGSGARP